MQQSHQQGLEAASVRLILVRHGLTEWNTSGKYQGHTDISLSSQGDKQAQALAVRLSHENITRVYSSDLMRARQTAERIAAYHSLPVITDPRLREMSFGEWEGLTFEEIGERWPELQKRWLEDPVSLCAPGGEPAEALHERLREALRHIYKDLSRYQAKQGTAATGVIVTHGGALRALMAFSSTGSLKSLWKFSVLQASISAGELTPAGLKLTTWNDVSHLA